MDRNVKKIISISTIVFIFYGWTGLSTLLTAVKDTYIAFFPVFAGIAKQSLEDYLTSPYFITGAIMFILSSGFGIWVGKTGGKLIYLIVSILIAILSFVSIGAKII